MIALRQVGEPFDAASDMGSLALDLATGYVAGGTFYFLTIWRPKAVERERVLPIVARDAIQLAGAASSFVHHLRYAAGATLMEGPLDRQHFESVVRDLSPSANANKINLDGKPASLADALDYEWRRQEHLETKIERWAGLASERRPSGARAWRG